MATVTVNGKDIVIGDQERLNVVQVAARAGVEVPHYCYHPALTVVASCRMCLVEVGDKKPDGTVAMQPKVLPGCQTPVKDGTVIVTDSPKVKAAQAGTLEYLLLNHPLDCPTCDQAGECYLQDYTFKYGRGAETRMVDQKLYKPDKDHIGDNITLFTDRCIMCSRCVRFTREISGTAELQIVNRGSHAEIDIFPGEPCNNKLAGNVVDLCPVGALCSKDFLYKQRVWWLKSFDSVCAGCSTGCSIHVDQNDNTVYRLKPRTNPQAQGYFMCDEGRFGWKYLKSAKRLTQPQIKVTGSEKGGDDRIAVEWPAASERIKQMLAEFKDKQTGAIAGLFSPMMTVEDAYTFAEFLRSVDSDAAFYLAPVPVVGEDDQYPKDHHNLPILPAKFTIRAEKAPNRIGVTKVLEHFQHQVKSFEQLLGDIDSGKVSMLYAVGGYPEEWVDANTATRIRKVRHLVVQDILENSLTKLADAVLPGAGFAEKDGTYVNHAGLAQAINRAVRPLGNAKADAAIFLELKGHRGLFNVAAVRREIAQHLEYFKAFEVGKLDPLGVRLGQSAAEPALAGSH